MDDPAGNSYVQDLYYPENDPNLHVEDYDRTYEQDDDLGINDMKVENYASGPIDDEDTQSWIYSMYEDLTKIQFNARWVLVNIFYIRKLLKIWMIKKENYIQWDFKYN